MTIGEFLREQLAQKYNGRTVKNNSNAVEFVVSHIEVRDGGVDPQWEIYMCSEFCRLVTIESGEWHRTNNPLGGVLAPKELTDRWYRGYAECVYMTSCDHQLPEIINIPEPEEEDNMDLGKCDQCGELAWDGYICHACGAKNI